MECHKGFVLINTAQVVDLVKQKKVVKDLSLVDEIGVGLLLKVSHS